MYLLFCLLTLPILAGWAAWKYFNAAFVICYYEDGKEFYHDHERILHRYNGPAYIFRFNKQYWVHGHQIDKAVFKVVRYCKKEQLVLYLSHPDSAVRKLAEYRGRELNENHNSYYTTFIRLRTFYRELKDKLFPDKT